MITRHAQAQTTTWIGDVNSLWSDVTSWDNGVPGPGFQVVFNGLHNGNCRLDGPVTIGSLQVNGYIGIIDLAGNTLTVSGTIANNFLSGTIIGAPGVLDIQSSQAATFDGTALDVNLFVELTTSNGVFTGESATTFSSPVNVIAHSILLNGSTYRSTATFRKSSAAAPTASIGDGGNRFDDVTTIVNAMNATLISGNLEPDVFNGQLILSLTGNDPACKIQMAYGSAGNQFNNDIRIRTDDNSLFHAAPLTAEISFGSGGGASTLADGFTIAEVDPVYDPNGTSDEFSYGDLYLNNFTQLGSTPQYLNLRIPQNDASSASRLKLIIQNSTFNGNVDFLASNIFVSGSTFNGASNRFEKTVRGGSNIGIIPQPHSSWAGGNTFNNTTTIVNSGGSYLGLGVNQGDVFNGDVTFIINSATGNFRIAYGATTQFRGDVTLIRDNLVGGQNFYFGDAIQGGAAEFNGAAQQFINYMLGGSTTVVPPNFHNVSVINPNGLVLGVSINILTSMQLNLGVVQTTGTNYIDFRDNSTVSNASNFSYVDGPVRKTGNDAFTFPVGDNGVYNPLSISAPGSTTSQFEAEYFFADHGLGVEAVDGIEKVSDCEHWTLNQTAGTDNVGITLGWNEGSFCHPSYINPDHIDALRVMRWASSEWSDLGSSAYTTPYAAIGSVTSSATLGSFPSILTLGSTVIENAMPVELTSLEAKEINGKVLLTWETATELNNDYFTIEKLEAGSFAELAKIPGAGTKNLPSQYTWIDQNPTPGLCYYRLKQTDFNGTATYSDVIAFRWQVENTPYPNPVKTTLFLDGLNFGEDSELIVKDLTGRTLYSSNAIRMIDFSEYVPGIYHLGLKTNTSITWFPIRKE